MAKIKEQLKPPGKLIWSSTYGTYISGQAAIDGADQAALAMELKWGAGRLRLLVDTGLRERFDRQRFKFNTASRHGTLQEVLEQAPRMVAAWMALDRAAEAGGAFKLDPLVWELTLPDGVVVALVRSREEARAVNREGRKVVVYDLDELARMLQNYREVTATKEIIPGAIVTAIRREISDPLERFDDREAGLDDPLHDVLPEYAQ